MRLAILTDDRIRRTGGTTDRSSTALGLPDSLNIERIKDRVIGYQRHPIFAGLCDKHSIERIAMVAEQCAGSLRVFKGNLASRAADLRRELGAGSLEAGVTTRVS